MNGYFSNKGELFFEIDLIAADKLVITIDAMLDTGFTDWLAMDIQDIKSLGWSFKQPEGKQSLSFMRVLFCLMVSIRQFLF